MKTLLENLNHQPHNLTAEEIESPDCSIAYFFDKHPLYATREKLAKLYQGWLYHHALNPDPIDLTDMTCFFSCLTEMINLSYIVAYRYDEVNPNAVVSEGHETPS